MTDQKELKTKKCSKVGCKNKADSMKDKKYYCDHHFQNVRQRQRRDEYWRF